MQPELDLLLQPKQVRKIRLWQEYMYARVCVHLDFRRSFMLQLMQSSLLSIYFFWPILTIATERGQGEWCGCKMLSAKFDD